MAVRTSIAANGDTRLALVTKPRRTTTNGLSFHFISGMRFQLPVCFLSDAPQARHWARKPFLSRPKSAPSEKRIQAGRRGFPASSKDRGSHSKTSFGTGAGSSP